MIIFTVNIAGGTIDVELVEQGQNFNAVRVISTATVPVRCVVKLSGSIIYDQIIAPGTNKRVSVPQKNLVEFLEGSLQEPLTTEFFPV